MSELVIFDLETAGLQEQARFYTDLEWSALHESRRPAVAVGCWRKRSAISDEVDPAPPGPAGEWDRGILCPPSPVIQIAAIAVDTTTWDELDAFEVKLGFRRELAADEALELNSFDRDVWLAESKRVRPALKAFDAFLKRHAHVKRISARGRPWYTARLCGYNAATFDLPLVLRDFADPEWQAYALPSDPPRTSPSEPLWFSGGFDVLDVLHLARWWSLSLEESCRPEDLKLETVAAYYDIEHDAHDALGDVRATAGVLKNLSKEISL